VEVKAQKEEKKVEEIVPDAEGTASEDVKEEKAE
jgi:hypothetical protein